MTAAMAAAALAVTAGAATADSGSDTRAAVPGDTSGGQAPVTVQLNQDTAALHGMVDHFQRADANVALADCPGATPGSTTFSSPVLRFSGYDFGPFVGVKATVSADAELLSGTAAGSYPLTVTCGGKPYTTTFSVPAAQVSQVPSGAAKAGDGSLAE
ncbi:hypothetical protein [Amycolatopsis jiangsuensis]